MIRIGLPGCGRIARIHHIPILARESGVELATLASAIVLAAEIAAREGRRRPVEALAS
jgi:predicted dehydrogenase